jgi:hypothetical protein
MPSSRLTVSRVLIFGAISLLLVTSVILFIRWRQLSTAQPNDPYASVPFRPRVTYQSSDVVVGNTETEPYFDLSVNVYVGGTLYSAPLGTLAPGETKRCHLRSLTNNRGETFDPNAAGVSELEVRARFKGYAVHKDFPPPHD